MRAANHAWYWLAAGVLALGLNGYYQDGGFQGLHRLATGTCLAVNQARAQIGQIATLAEVAMADHAQVRSDRPSPAVVAINAVDLPAGTQARLAQLQERLQAMQAARVQARVARLQEVMARREMQRAQVEIRNGRITVLSDQGQVRVAIPPLPRVEVSVPQAPVVEVSEPN
ncbi:MAG TPA: hypothetical protein VKR26_14500 [Terriglobales bacterium]|nr:hypothetical protein [Terriglobales bacterium]